MSDISDRVKKIVVEHLGVDEDKVVDNASFIDDLGADSLDTVELVMAFEEEFGIEIPDDAAENIENYTNLQSFFEILQYFPFYFRQFCFCLFFIACFEGIQKIFDFPKTTILGLKNCVL